MSAIRSALELAHRPSLVRAMRRRPLPSGMTFLLEIAANEPESVARAVHVLRQPPSALRDAADFFVEQILLSSGSDDSYRILGARTDESTTVLRRHMALLMKWVHPDVAIQRNGGSSPNPRELFAPRFTKAWNDLKSDERRADYDAARQRTAENHRLLRQKRIRRVSKSKSGDHSEGNPRTMNTGRIGAMLARFLKGSA